jgi:adenine-specific DNA-methyltransferase
MPKKKQVVYPSSPGRTRIPVSTLKHKDKRVNIPTEELRDFVAEEEKTPKKMLYPRDPSLDPQLVWKGKDEQDGKPLEVPIVPIYIQEKIHPIAIVEQVRAEAKKETPTQAELFLDFNGIKFEELIDFYKHEQNWSNRMILGDSLLVMTSLAEKEGLKAKIQTIYFDPPYGIKFGSNWQVSTRRRDVKDGRAEDATRQPEQVKAFRDTWQLGIHSYLAYLRDRLTAAQELLTESGSIFVQMGDENVHLVRSVMDEVFGSENFCRIIKVYKTTSQTSELVAETVDYILWYAKKIETIKFRKSFREISVAQAIKTSYQFIEAPDGARTPLRQLEVGELERELRSGYRLLSLSDLTSQTGGENSRFPIVFGNHTYTPNRGGWRTNRDGMENLKKAQRLGVKGQSIRFPQYLSDFGYTQITDIWDDLSQGGFVGDEKIYVVQTNPKIIERCILMTTDPGDLVLDPTCGSGTTASVAEHLGRRWITIDTSRVAIALARTRLMSTRFPYYILFDSQEGAKKEAEVAGQLPFDRKTDSDIKKGFVYKRVPHVTLKSIANNEEIDAIYGKWQARMVPVCEKLNKALSESWEEWQIPRRAEEKWSEKAKVLHADWWKMRRERQRDIDASIAHHADKELLYDQPYDDPKRIRVTGQFTVESLSPHRVLSTDEGRPQSEIEGKKESVNGRYENIIIENLKRAGVQNTVKNGRLKFERLEPFAGQFIHATGEYLESGKTKRIAVCIGGEHSTVSPDLIKDAAKEAVQGVGFDLLIVCGFAFDPHVPEETKRYGKLQVLAARMNPDLMMGDELLKKTGAGNLFMVFGEPDIEMKKSKAGKVEVTIKGVDVYDPTTGEIRSRSTDDIACWFIDTNYNGESFFVRHAYFTGAEEPYEKLKRALRAEIDEGAWSALYTTKSQAFDPPVTGKIAVKVINHYGDEVLKVYEVK